MNQKVYTLQDIKYCKESGEKTVRTVIPTFIPQNNMKAIDVTDLTGDERTELLHQLDEYADYVQSRQALIFNFEDWLAQTTGSAEVDPVKWRTFKLANTSFLAE